MSVDSCVILCGGASSRLKGASGESKIFLPFGGKSLVAHNFSKMSEIFGRVFIACKENQVDLIGENILACHSERSEESKNKSANLVDYSVASLPQNNENTRLLQSRCDSHKNQSDIFIIESPEIFAPIIGIISALTQLQSQKVFFISCDCPFVSRFAIQSICESAPNYDIVFAKDSHKIHPLIAVWSANLLPILQDSLEKGDFRLQNIIDKAHSKALEFDKSEFFNINTKENYATALESLRKQNLRESRAKILLESIANHAPTQTLG